MIEVMKVLKMGNFNNAIKKFDREWENTKEYENPRKADNNFIEKELKEQSYLLD